MDALTKITPEVFPQLCDTLLRELDPQMPASMWRRVFVDHASPEYGGGYLLADGGKFVGLVGAIYSERTIQGRKARFCNVHGWYVQPEFRGRSLLLMRPLLRLSDHTVTDLSPTKSVSKISRRLGFELLDSHAWLLLPMRSRKTSVSSLPEILPVDDSTAALLSDADRQIFEDHRLEHCGHLLVRDGGGYSYVVYSRSEHRWFSYCFIYYISDRGRFLEHQREIRARLMEATGTRCVVIESRLLPGVKPLSSLRIPTYDKLYRPAGVPASEIDNLYSDVVNLRLSTIPRMRRLLLTPLFERVPMLRRWTLQAAPRPTS